MDSVLPERQAKVTQLLRSLGEHPSQDEAVYCICRKGYDSRFMIACDACDDWFHGECVGLSEAKSKFVKKYYCPLCRERNPSLSILYKKKKLEKERQKKLHRRDKEKRKSDRSKDVDFFPSKKHKEQDEMRKRRERRVKKFKESLKKKKKKIKRVNKPLNVSISELDTPSTRASTITEISGDEIVPDASCTQCLGPGCTSASRPGSKYCSDDCGLKLAERRLLDILPLRLKQWKSTPSVADQHCEQQLDELRRKQAESKEHLSELDRREQDLRQLVARAKRTSVDSEQESKSETEEEASDSSYHCPMCAHSILPKAFVKHLAKCFVKVEQQTSFGSMFKTKIEGNTMFCDSYNPQHKTYCKRLRVICPEHYKEKVDPDEVCGFPLVTDLFEETGEFCSNSKKKCPRHNSWERLRQAEIDMERVRTWMLIEDLFEQERTVKTAMSERASVLALMLHRTIDHEHEKI